MGFCVYFFVYNYIYKGEVCLECCLRELSMELPQNFMIEYQNLWFEVSNLSFHVIKQRCIKIHGLSLPFDYGLSGYKMNRFSAIQQMKKWDILINHEEVSRSHIFLYISLSRYGDRNAWFGTHHETLGASLDSYLKRHSRHTFSYI